jgi:hypothetical protein
VSLDEDLRRELRETLGGNPSLRRLVELERLATAIAEHGRRRPPVAIFQLPEGTAGPQITVGRLAYRLIAPRELLVAHKIPVHRGESAAIPLSRDSLDFTFRGLERFRRADPLRPTFEATPRSTYRAGSLLRALWVPLVELEVTGVVAFGAPEAVAISFVRTRVPIRDFEGPIVVELLLDPVRLA